MPPKSAAPKTKPARPAKASALANGAGGGGGRRRLKIMDPCWCPIL